MLRAAEEPSAKAMDGGMPDGQSSACSTVTFVCRGMNCSMTLIEAVQDGHAFVFADARERLAAARAWTDALLDRLANTGERQRGGR